MPHRWLLILSKSNDMPGGSVDDVWWCECCGMVKHDYHYDNGRTSPNYPVIRKPGIAVGVDADRCFTEDDLTSHYHATIEALLEEK